jgi:hypothetical protein
MSLDFGNPTGESHGARPAGIRPFGTRRESPEGSRSRMSTATRSPPAPKRCGSGHFRAAAAYRPRSLRSARASRQALVASFPQMVGGIEVALRVRRELGDRRETRSSFQERARGRTCRARSRPPYAAPEAVEPPRSGPRFARKLASSMRIMPLVACEEPPVPTNRNSLRSPSRADRSLCGRTKRSASRVARCDRGRCRSLVDAVAPRKSFGLRGTT